MPIDFLMDRWEKVKGDATRWWAGKLKRPLIQMRLTNPFYHLDGPGQLLRCAVVDS